MDTEIFFILKSGENIPVKIETRRGMRNIVLKPKTYPIREICISKPWMVSKKEVLRFLNTKRTWLEHFFVAAPLRIHFSSGNTIDILGKRVLVLHDKTQKGNKYIQEDKSVLLIGGADDMFERRIKDIVKKDLLCEVKKIIKTFPQEYWPDKITLKDMVSRWGSCSSNRNISLSWRLGLAPYDVMRYVVCHESAHVLHMNHSKEFWNTVSLLYGIGVERAKKWLVQNGSSLYKYL